jgi:hypothetical protein
MRWSRVRVPPGSPLFFLSGRRQRLTEWDAAAYARRSGLQETNAGELLDLDADAAELFMAAFHGAPGLNRFCLHGRRKVITTPVRLFL